MSQERLGDRAGLSGKFIGEVERGEKSISVDSLYHVACALELPLSRLTDFAGPAARPNVASAISELVAGQTATDLRRACLVLRAVLDGHTGDHSADLAVAGAARARRVRGAARASSSAVRTARRRSR